MSIGARRKVKFSNGAREPRESSCRRFHISDARLQALLDDGTLWYAANPRTGICEVVGHLPGRSAVAFENSRSGERMGVVSFFTGESRGILANLAWGAIWWALLFALVLPFSYLNLKSAAFCATTLLGLVVWWSKIHPAPDVTYDGDVVRVPVKMTRAEYCASVSGDGIFDEVSTRRQEELQWLLGTGRYAKDY